MLVRSKLGICQWFHYEDAEAVKQAVHWLRDLGIRHLRTGISWANFHRPGGAAWYERQMRELAEFELLVSIWHTPPSIAEGGTCASPPRRLQDFADFVGQVIELFGDCISALELWNEPNNSCKWDFARYDPDWAKFGTMIRGAAAAAKGHGMTTVLGGMIPVDHDWLARMHDYGALESIDVVAIHGFPEMWSAGTINWECRERWKGWEEKLADIRRFANGRPIWITETGRATWDLAAARPCCFERQAFRLRQAAAASAERVYWYSLADLPPDRKAIEGFHVDEYEYHMGLIDARGRKKHAYGVMQRLLAAGDATVHHLARRVPLVPGKVRL